jgi:hypothetical protein
MLVSPKTGPKPSQMNKVRNSRGLLQGVGEKRALYISVSYRNIPGVQLGESTDWDVRVMSELLQVIYPELNEGNTVIMKEGEDLGRIPDRANCVAAMEWLVSDAKPGDSLFFFFSGHGVREGYSGEESILPCDYRTCGSISKSEMYDLLVAPLPKGCQLTAVMDCCYAQKMLDLPWLYNIEQPGQIGGQELYRADSEGTVVLFSSSASSSICTTYGGFATRAFIIALILLNRPTYIDLLQQQELIMDQDMLDNKILNFTGKPQISSSHRLNLDSEFTI